MAGENNNSQVQPYSNDVSTRIRDLEERNKIIKERTHIVSRNLIDFKEEIKEEIKVLKQKTTQMERELEKLKSITNALINETGKYVKKEEINKVERMLKDFQPLEFVRMSDLEELFNKKFLETKKQINQKK